MSDRTPVLSQGSVGVVGRGTNLRAVLLDTQGPEIRTTKLKDDASGKHTVALEKGSSVTLRSGEGAGALSDASTIYIQYGAGVHNILQAGTRVLLDDGAVSLTVSSVDGEDVRCKVLNDGKIRSRVGVNLPGVKTNLPAMSEKDRVDIRYGVENDVDFVAASFVRDAAGVREIRSYIASLVEGTGGTAPLIISKIENVEGVNNFSEILEESDAIMVARGDLGVEIELESVTIAQKEMVAQCNAVGKPVIVATQMLESMTKNPRPTRAEVSDVTNAVIDGADAVMLSGETAKGNYPVETVRTMQSIIATSESLIARKNDDRMGRPSGFDNRSVKKEHCDFDIVARAAVTASKAAAAIIVMTKTGRTAQLISSYRPDVPILCICPTHKVGRQLQIYRGCHPIVDEDLRETNFWERGFEATKLCKELKFVLPGDKVVLVTAEKGDGLGLCMGMKVGTVGAE
ncbi:hypothetical protein TeGR_g12226 [Tetraparma gracilis]|uniref:Pyruvate kinase n=1 Tax=Tetraparma gracilis TaxID=2962635 RepID=A0ABQ6MIW6_9STRA|nr:hypothetical protein TeGR_g12226 [Tetraparma gracilis]